MAETKQWKVFTYKTQDKHNDFEYTTRLEERLNEVAAEGYEPAVIQEMSRPGGTPFVAIIARRIKTVTS